jgi:GT2 family glycosyltransferase/predicted SAM-dependent methyltransferase/predicted O-methyltransferase YrrM
MPTDRSSGTAGGISQSYTPGRFDILDILGLAEAQKIDGWMSEEELSFLGSHAAEAKTALQIGCYKGRSSYVIGKNIKGSLLDIDSFVGDFGNALSSADLAATYIKNIDELLGTKIEVMIGNSQDILKILNKKFDLIFIDGSHSYINVKKDIQLSIPLLRPGGLLCGHDYSHSLEVKRAVDDIFGENVKLYNNTSIWFINDGMAIKGYLSDKSKKGKKIISKANIRKLHLGCGAKILPDYINIDLYRSEADLQLDITDLSFFEDYTIDEIYLNAVFEHLYSFEQEKALSEWHRVLKQGGIIRIDSTPDFDEVIKAYIAQTNGNTRNIFDLDEVMRYTHGVYCEADKIGGLHKDIFTKKKLKRLLENAGFEVTHIESMRWGNEPNPVNINVQARKPRDINKDKLPTESFSAVYCVYDDDVWLTKSLSSVYCCCDRIIFLIGDRPWHGNRSDNNSTLRCIQNFPDPHRKIQIIYGTWENEADQRNAGLQLVKKEGHDYCFIIDADEIYDSAQLKNMMIFATTHPEIECWHMTWDTYWKTPSFKIEPREPFKPVVFVKSDGARFTENRDVSGNSHGFVPPEIGFCHHLSYARSDEQVRKKIATFSHAQEIHTDWFQSVWKAWDADHLLLNLHPTHPPAYRQAVYQPIIALPPVLRSSVTDHPSAANQTSIVILTFNQLDHTKKCVNSIQKHTPEAHEIIFVDNASTDGTVEWLRQMIHENSNYRLIENKENLGFAAGNNQGLAEANGDYLLLLNNDTVVTEGWLARMLSVFNRYLEVGIVGPVSNYVSGPQQVKGGSYQNLEEMQCFAKQWSAEHQEQTMEFQRVVGFCLLAKREVIDRIGGLDEQFGSGNFEDDDFCLRAAVAGYKARIAQDAFIHHTGSQTFKAAGINYQKSLEHNWEIFKTKWKLPQNLPYGAPYNLNPDPKNLSQYYIPLPPKSKISLTSNINPLEKTRDPLVPISIFKKMVQSELTAGNWEQAIQLLTEALNSNQANAAAEGLWNDLGYCYFMANLPHQAETAFSHGLKINPRNLDLLNNLASLYLHQEDYSRATDYVNSALRLNPHDVGALRTLGDCAIKLARFDDALRAYVHIKMLSPATDGLDQMIAELARLAGPCATQPERKRHQPRPT